MEEIDKLAMMKVLMPTPEKLRKGAIAWLDRCRHTLLDQWPREYRDLSMPTELVQVDALEMSSFWENEPMPTAFAKRLADRLDKIIGWDNRFIRLNSRSPKDGCWPMAIPVTRSGKEAVSWIAASERCLDDVCKFCHVPEQPLYICLREVAYGLRPEREFRCFVKDEQLIAVTAYDYTTGKVDAPKDGGKHLRGEIEAFFKGKIRPCLPTNDLVVDVWFDGPTIKLVEINPYGLSDPCFFEDYANVESANSFIQFSRPTPPKDGEAG